MLMRYFSAKLYSIKQGNRKMSLVLWEESKKYFFIHTILNEGIVVDGKHNNN